MKKKTTMLSRLGLVLGILLITLICETKSYSTHPGTTRRGDVWVSKYNETFLIISSNQLNESLTSYVSGIWLSPLNWVDLTEETSTWIYLDGHYFTAWTNNIQTLPIETLKTKKGNIKDSLQSGDVDATLRDTLNIGKEKVNLGDGYRRGNIYRVNFPGEIGIHPAVILAKNQDYAVVSKITSQLRNANFFYNLVIPPDRTGLPKNSVLIVSSTMTVPMSIVGRKLGQLDTRLINSLDRALRRTFSLVTNNP